MLLFLLNPSPQYFLDSRSTSLLRFSLYSQAPSLPINTLVAVEGKLV
jgi:hypothetical protein